MPKILNYSENSDYESVTTLLSNPIDWAWNSGTIYTVDKKDDFYIMGDFNDPITIQYGIFKKENDINSLMSAICIKLVDGKSLNLSSNIIPIIENISTGEQFRKKGYAKVLYKFILYKYNTLLSDSKIFTDKDKISKTLGIWINYLPTISKVSNFNLQTKQKTEFKLNNSETIRFISERI